MRDEKLKAVVQYLNVHFPNCEVLQEHDFDRDAQSFKVMLGRDTVLLKVTDTFIDDGYPDDITASLDQMEAGEELQKTIGTGKGVLVTMDGLKRFERG